jgi:sulfatase maturation enzyme AslB (radical SAM superfamily)
MKNLYCNKPFREITTTVDGKYLVCPWSMIEYGSIFDVNLDDYIQSEYLNNIKKNMMENILSNDLKKLCEKCLRLEEKGLNSNRDDEIYNGKYFEIYNVNHIGNRCNLKCIGCGPERSSQYGPLIDVDKNLDYDLQDFYELKEINILGGEPFLSPLTKKILLNNLKWGVKVTVVTNGLFFPKYLYDLKFKENLNIFISYDGVGELDDYLRVGSNFEKKLKNTKLFFENFNTNIMLTINFINYFFIDSIKQFFLEKFNYEIKTANRMMIPNIFDPINLPKHLKNNFSDRFKNEEPDNDVLLSGISYFKTKDLLEGEKKFLKFMPQFIDEYNRVDINKFEKQNMRDFSVNVPDLEIFNI